jgi:pimeloyl-ACP methyl ester carboxylesterase
MTERIITKPRAIDLDIDGDRIYGEWRREPVFGRPILVFLHDGLGSIENWRSFPDCLADRMGLGAFAYDRFGYGRSGGRDPWPDDFMAEATQRLPLILEVAGIRDFILIGHSDGATIALDHAATSPAGLRAVVSLAAHVKRDPGAYRGVIEFAETARGNELPDWLNKLHGDRGRQVLTCWARCWKTALDAGWDISPKLRGITAPIWAALGRDDPWAYPLQLEAIAKYAPHAQTRLLDGYGHFPHLENPEPLIVLIEDFLRPVLLDIQ